MSEAFTERLVPPITDVQSSDSATMVVTVPVHGWERLYRWLLRKGPKQQVRNCFQMDETLYRVQFEWPEGYYVLIPVKNRARQRLGEDATVELVREMARAKFDAECHDCGTTTGDHAWGCCAY